MQKLKCFLLALVGMCKALASSINRNQKKKKILENNHNKKTKFLLSVDSLMSGMGNLLNVLWGNSPKSNDVLFQKCGAVKK